jgi:hypothetical protein
MDIVIATAAIDPSIPTVPAVLPASSSVPSVEWMSHKFLHWGDDCEEAPHPLIPRYAEERKAVLAPLAAAFFAGGEKAVIKAASGNSHGDVSHCWCLAMNVVYGPTRLHESWLDENGRPSAEALAKFPDLAGEIERNRSRLRSFLGVYD